MCNHRHEDSKTPSKKSGIGYKIFRTCHNGEIVPLVNNDSYKIQEDGWIVWGDEYLGWRHREYREWSCREYREWRYQRDNETKYGFCCFPSLREASDAFLSWNHDRVTNPNSIIHKIKYSDAFARHIETGMCNRVCYYPGGPKKGFRTLLVKKFRILEQVEPIIPIIWEKPIY